MKNLIAWHVFLAIFIALPLAAWLWSRLKNSNEEGARSQDKLSSDSEQDHPWWLSWMPSVQSKAPDRIVWSLLLTVSMGALFALVIALIGLIAIQRLIKGF